MGSTTSSPLTGRYNISTTTTLFLEICLFYPVYGLHYHVDLFRKGVSSQFSSSALETMILTPFVQPISKKMSNLELLTKYGNQYWAGKYLDENVHRMSNSTFEHPITVDTIQITNPQHYLYLKSIQDQSSLSQIDKATSIPKSYPPQHQNVTIDNSYPLTYLKLIPIKRFENFATTHGNSPFYSLLTNSPLLLSGDEKRYDEVVPFHIGYYSKLPLLPHNYKALYPNYIKHKLRPSSFTFADDEKSRPENIFQLPRPYTVQFEFPYGTSLYRYLYGYETTFKPPTHMGTIVIIDFISQESINEFYLFIYKTYDYMLKGCIIPLTSVDLHILGLNMDRLDTLIIDKNTVLDYCTKLGFESIQIHTLSGSEYPYNFFTYDEYMQFYETLWTKIEPEFFEWVHHHEEVAEIEKGVIITPTIGPNVTQSNKPQTELPASIQHQAFHYLLSHRQWPIMSSQNFSITLPYAAKVDDIFHHPIEDVLNNFRSIIASTLSVKNPESINPLELLLPAKLLYTYLKLIEKYNTIPLQPISQNGNSCPNGQLQRYIPPVRTLASNICHIENHLHFGLENAQLEKKQNVADFLFASSSRSNNPNDQIIIEPPRFIDTSLQSKLISSSSLSTPTEVVSQIESLDNSSLQSQQSSELQLQSKEQRSLQYPGLPSKFKFDAFISVDTHFLISDPYLLFLIPRHSNPDPNHTPTDAELQQENILGTELKNLPPSLHAIRTDYPQSPYFFRRGQLPSLKTSKQVKLIALIRIHKLMVEPIITKTFGLPDLELNEYCGHKYHIGRKVNVLHVQPTNNTTITTPQCIFDLNKDCTIQSQSTSIPNTTTTTTEEITPLEPQSYIHTPQKVPGYDFIQFTHKLQLDTNTTTQISHQQEQQQEQQEQYDIDLLYKTFRNDLFKSSQQSNRGQDIWLLPHQYTFGLRITPFVFIREYWPLLFEEWIHHVSDYHIHIPELYQSILHKISNVYDRRENPHGTVLNRSELPPSIILYPDYKPIINPTPIPSYHSIYKDCYVHRYQRSFGTLPTYVGDIQTPFQANNQFCDPAQIQWWYNILYSDCPVHFIIYCINPVVMDDDNTITRDILHTNANEYIRTKLDLDNPTPITKNQCYDGPYQGIRLDSAVFEQLNGTKIEPEPITYNEYQFFKTFIPKIYHREFILTIAPLFAYIEFEKLETQITFHFVAQYEFQSLFQQIQSHCINSKIMLLRDNIIAHQ